MESMTYLYLCTKAARDPFTARIVVDTGDGWGPNAVKTITPLKPACSVLRFGDLASRPFGWPDLVHDEPEALSFRHEPFSLRPHQKVAFDDVTGGFKDNDRGKLIMACGTGKTFTALRIAEAVAGIGGRGALSGAVDIAVPAIDAGMGDATVDPASLHRGLLRYTRRTKRRAAYRILASRRSGHRPSTGRLRARRTICTIRARQHRGSTIRIVGGGRRCQTVDFATGYPSVALFYDGGRKTFL